MPRIPLCQSCDAAHTIHRKVPSLNVLIVHAHEELTSFNGAMRETAVTVLAESGHTLDVSDLYVMRYTAV